MIFLSAVRIMITYMNGKPKKRFALSTGWITLSLRGNMQEWCPFSPKRTNQTTHKGARSYKSKILNFYKPLTVQNSILLIGRDQCVGHFTVNMYQDQCLTNVWLIIKMYNSTHHCLIKLLDMAASVNRGHGHICTSSVYSTLRFCEIQSP